MAKPPLVNLADVSLHPFGQGEQFAAQLGRIAPALGMEKMGCSLIVLAPGKRAFPFHEHYAHEELFIILEGSGTMRFGEEQHPVRSGDVIFTPPGKGTAHQIINDSDSDLRYLAMSSTDSPEICFYPDSGKYVSFHYADGNFAVSFMTPEGDGPGYWDGED